MPNAHAGGRAVNAAEAERNTYITPAQKRQQGAKRSRWSRCRRRRRNGQRVEVASRSRRPAAVVGQRLEEGRGGRRAGRRLAVQGPDAAQPVDVFNNDVSAAQDLEDSETPKTSATAGGVGQQAQAPPRPDGGAPVLAAGATTTSRGGRRRRRVRSAGCCRAVWWWGGDIFSAWAAAA